MLTFAENGRYGPEFGSPLYTAPDPIPVEELEQMWNDSGENWIFFAEAIQNRFTKIE